MKGGTYTSLPSSSTLEGPDPLLRGISPSTTYYYNLTLLGISYKLLPSHPSQSDVRARRDLGKDRRGVAS